MYAVFSSTGTQGKSTQDFRRFATRLVITADAWFSPRHANALPMTCSSSSPFSYQLRFTPNLQPSMFLMLLQPSYFG
ncbi:hypothetical protein H6F88_28515 [Oculatella sp. FACHB-28]|uniref:hypothetical protein n=1 Tax=Oculatella sp. FACHB-28 TaxID=2692845 RepID=UPI0016838679|nr:hypothetical protein [Oculatella sp. FACHB-28]MBD2059886.1 hypothetical protein [Oculatella sp. FACHB-28]